jgi:two-component system NtrC family sensor kinase
MGFLAWLPISRKIILSILPLFLLFISVSVLVQNSFQEQEMLDQARVSAVTAADLLQESLVSMMVTNQEVDSTFLVRLNGIEEFDSVRVVVNDLRLREEVLTTELRDRRGRKDPLMVPTDTVQREVLASGEPLFYWTGSQFRSVIPFTATKVCQRCHAVPVDYVLGAADMLVSYEHVSTAADENWKRSLLIFLLFTGMVGGLATLMFRRFVSRPIDRLVVSTDEISTGNLERPVVPSPVEPEVRDELMHLAGRFEEMRISLNENIRELDETNRELALRNKQLEHALGDLRRAQEDLVRSERLAATGRLTAQLSHEINNPVHNIQSLLESTARRIDANPRAQELIATALEEITRLAKLTRQMLDVFRGSMVEMEREPVELAALVDEIVEMSRAACGERGIGIQAEHHHARLEVLGARDKLKQVLLNLVLNGQDAQPEGGSLRIRTMRRAGRATIQVSDEGIGIPPENLNKIFDAFFTTKDQVSGVGLGLSVSYGIIQQHNGNIRVESAVGKGTSFTVEIPLLEKEHD